MLQLTKVALKKDPAPLPYGVQRNEIQYKHNVGHSYTERIAETPLMLI